MYDLLEKEGLSRLPVPKDPPGNEDLKSFVFGTEDLLRNDKLMVLIHGSGVVRAGQWARRLIINDNLESGSQLGYIRKARALGYAVLVLNTNDNFRFVEGKKRAIPVSVMRKSDNLMIRKGRKMNNCSSHFMVLGKRRSFSARGNCMEGLHPARRC